MAMISGKGTENNVNVGGCEGYQIKQHSSPMGEGIRFVHRADRAEQGDYIGLREH